MSLVSIGRFTGAGGTSGIEISGIRDGKEIVSGDGSQGNFWNLEFTKRTAETAEASNSGKLPDGRTIEGKYVCRRIDEKSWTWEFTGKTCDGEDLTMKATYKRKAD